MHTHNVNRRRFLQSTLSVPVAAGLPAYLPATRPPGHMQTGDDEFEANEKIQEARDVALNILQPSRKDLEHGMELHHNSLVVESYGFSPWSAPDGDRLAAAIEEGASDIELRDLREDMEMTRCVEDAYERQEYMNAWKASGVTCILQNAGEEGNAIDRLIKRLARYTYVTDFLRDFVSKAVTPDDIVAAKEQNRRCLYMTGNGVPLPQQWNSVEEELRFIRVFYELGVRMMHLTYNRRNMIGDGCGEAVDGGLSDFGRAVVREMNRVGVIVDVAHSGWQTSLDAAKTSARPMVVSHSGCAALNNHYRCKPDNVIRAVVDTGGYIGICCIPNFLGGNGNISAMLDHIDYVVRRFGPDHVTIGMDVGYRSRASARERAKYARSGKSRDRWEALWPLMDPYSGRTREQILSMAWTNWPLFTVGMVQRGYSDADIQKILGGNVLRVARAALA